MTQPSDAAAQAARSVVSQWLAGSGATANSDWLYREEEEGLVALIAAAIDRAVREEREACAKIAEHQMVYGDGRTQYPTYDAGWFDAAKACAAAIRARQRPEEKGR